MTKIVYTPIIDGEKSVFIYKSNIFESDFIDEIKGFLEKQDYKDGHCVSGREIPRKQIWYQKQGKYFCSDWKQRYDRWVAQPSYPKLLDLISEKIYQDKDIKKTLESHSIQYPNINSCLINKYRDGNDSIRAHRDTHLSFGPNPVIIGLSIGESRILRVRRLHNPNVFKSLKVEKSSDENIDFVLEENSIFVMAGYSQIYFSHEIPKMEDKGTRYSLTFREFIDKSNDNKSNYNKLNI
tara:strand:- start:212 stop:925 length:714 start_codon:yes stop_codon:yes gene_type:complete